MTKEIETLTEDIYHVLDSDYDHGFNPETAADAAMRVAAEFGKATVKRDSARVKGKLWASDIGKRCLRQHYYNFNEPDKAEKLDGHTKFKFLYGNLLEEAVLYYAMEAGHTVHSQQDRIEYSHNGWTISGKIDAIVDNCLIDVKSTSSYGYKRYKDGIDNTNDSFGYLEQLAFYAHFGDYSVDDWGFIWIDKQNGHVKYTPATVPTRSELLSRVDRIITAVEGEEGAAARGYAPEPYGKSGNMKLPVGCSYCPYKKHCWRDSNNGQGLRGFVYNHGPVWFTDVPREPRCPEITDDE